MRKSALVALILVPLVLPALAAAQPANPSKTPAAGADAKKDGANGNGFSLGTGTGDNKQPMQIEAEQGLEWRQNDKVYIARGNVKVTRGKGTVFADTVVAHYRPAPKTPAKPTQATAKNGDDPTEGTEIYNVEANGNVKMVSESDTIYADHVVYDIDSQTMIATGKNLKLVTPQETVTARDTFEWYDRDKVGVARGNAIAVRDTKVLRADVLVAATTPDNKGGDQLTRIDAQGNVKVTSQDQIGLSDTAVYNADTGIVTLIGHVKLTRGSDELRGEYAVIDTKRNVSRLLSEPPSATLVKARPARVEGLLQPPDSQKK